MDASAAVLLRIGTVWTFRLTLGRWRFVGIRDGVRVVVATSVGSILFFLLLLSIPLEPSVPRSVIAVEWVLTTYGTAGLWLTYPLAYELLRKHGDGMEGADCRAGLSDLWDMCDTGGVQPGRGRKGSGRASVLSRGSFILREVLERCEQNVVDVGNDQMIDPDAVEAAVTSGTKAISVQW